MITLLSQGTAEHLVAGRRAAYTQVLIAARQMDNAEHTGQTDEQYAGGHILINGLDIGPAIDAAVLETIVRIQPELENAEMWKRALRMPRRSWLTWLREKCWSPLWP